MYLMTSKIEVICVHSTNLLAAILRFVILNWWNLTRMSNAAAEVGSFWKITRWKKSRNWAFAVEFRFLWRNIALIYFSFHFSGSNVTSRKKTRVFHFVSLQLWCPFDRARIEDWVFISSLVRPTSNLIIFARQKGESCLINEASN